MSKQTERELTPEEKEEVVKRLQAIQTAAKDLKTQQDHCLGVLAELYNTTDPKIQSEVNETFIQAIAEADTNFVDVGREFKRRMNEAFQSILDQAPKDRVLDIEQRNLITATLLNLFKPIDEFLKDDESRREALSHILFINAALRAVPVRFNGCKQLWDAEDDMLKEAKERLRAAE